MPIKVFSSGKPQPPEVDGKYWLALAQEHLANEKSEDALTALRRAEALVPLDPEVYRLLAQALEASGRHPDALAAGLAVTALAEKSAVALFNIGTTYFTNRHWEPAEKWYRLALMLDADLAPANQNLAAILHQRGQWSEADVYRDRAYRCQSLFIDAAETPIRNILILCSARPGNVPFEQLLPETHNTRIKWVIEYSPDHALPSYDIVFNAIGDADVAVSSRKAVDDFLAGIKRPPLNPPQRVALTARDRIGDLLAGIADIRVPPVARWDRSQADAGNADVHARIAAAALPYPVIVRRIGAHGGDGVVLLESPQDAADIAHADNTYLTSYVDYKSADGYYRKYRVIFVDRKPYPYHLAISSHWLVHYDTADMLNPEWKIREEAWFLCDPTGALGVAAWAALEAIAKRMDLDYAGVDFSILPDGKLLIFEANATMLVHLETYHEALKFKNWHVLNIFDAFEQMLERRMENRAA